MRIRVLSGCLAISTVAIIGTGAAAQAATLSSSGETGGGNGYQTCPPGEQYSSQKKCCKPTPTPSPPCQCQTSSPPGWQWVVPPTPTPEYTTPTPVYTTPTPVYTTPTPVHTTPTPVYTTASASPTQVVPVVVSSSPVPSGPANTGGGMAGGSDIPLAAGGGAVALIAAPLGLVAFRRWRQTRGAA